MEVALLLSMVGRFDPTIQERLDCLMVIRMTVCGNDQIDGIHRDAISLHSPKEMVDMPPVTNIDEQSPFISKDVTIAIVFKGILPGIGIYTFFNDHKLSFTEKSRELVTEDRRRFKNEWYP
jgi:hypothetical protein